VISGLPEGLVYQAGFITENDERILLAELGRLPYRTVEMHGMTARRTTAHFGWDYGYESFRLSPAPPPPAFLLPLRALAAELAGVAPEALEEILVTRYPPGAGIGWHRDAPMFGPSVVGVSLGAAGVMRFRRRGESRSACRLVLEPRSVYVLSGAARADWQHTLSPQKAERTSVTFRTLL
jgi:DNA oxidative demethylase